jgi:hypothetical protein
MLMPAKNVEAKTIPSSKTMNSRHERTSRLKVYENDKSNHLTVSLATNFSLSVQSFRKNEGLNDTHALTASSQQTLSQSGV